MHSFFADQVTGGIIQLDAAESHHAIQVLRVRNGEQARVLNGKGTVYEAVFTEIHPRSCSLEIKHSESYPVPVHPLHIAIAPTKMNERMEWFLEKATEVGISQITPVICSRSERRVINLERFRKVVVAACKQSVQPWLPEVNPAIPLASFLKAISPGFMAHCSVDHPRVPLNKVLASTGGTTVLIGPEGDFTADEIEQALKLGWTGVSLGNSRLRTETAGLVACVTASLRKS